MERQVELVENVFDRERQLQEDIVARTLAPFGVVFDVLQQSAAALRRQAESLKDSARALERASKMIEAQAELFERAIGALRKPARHRKAGAAAPRAGPSLAPDPDRPAEACAAWVATSAATSRSSITSIPVRNADDLDAMDA
jgi:hypothetical protein